LPIIEVKTRRLRASSLSFPFAANRYALASDRSAVEVERNGNKPSDEKMSPYDPAKPPSPQFGNPVHCARIDREGLVYVCDRSNNRRATRGTGSVYDLVFSPDKERC
jgi:hypothetical protein